MKFWIEKKRKAQAKAELVNLIIKQARQISDMISDPANGRSNGCGISEEYLDAVRALKETASTYQALK